MIVYVNMFGFMFLRLRDTRAQQFSTLFNQNWKI